MYFLAQVCICSQAYMYVLCLQAINALGNVPSVTVHSALIDVVSCSSYYYAVRVQAANVLAMVSLLDNVCEAFTCMCSVYSTYVAQGCSQSG